MFTANVWYVRVVLMLQVLGVLMLLGAALTSPWLWLAGLGVAILTLGTFAEYRMIHAGAES